MEQQKALTIPDIIGSTVHTLIRRGVSGAAAFVGLCYELQKNGNYTLEEVTNLATCFVLGEEGAREDVLTHHLEARQVSQHFAKIMQRYSMAARETEEVVTIMYRHEFCKICGGCTKDTCDQGHGLCKGHGL